jgi:hypothetical protein
VLSPTLLYSLISFLHLNILWLKIELRIHYKIICSTKLLTQIVLPIYALFSLFKIFVILVLLPLSHRFILPIFHVLKSQIGFFIYLLFSRIAFLLIFVLPMPCRKIFGISFYFFCLLLNFMLNSILSLPIFFSSLTS